MCHNKSLLPGNRELRHLFFSFSPPTFPIHYILWYRVLNVHPPPRHPIFTHFHDDFLMTLFFHTTPRFMTLYSQIYGLSTVTMEIYTYVPANNLGTCVLECTNICREIAKCFLPFIHRRNALYIEWAPGWNCATLCFVRGQVRLCVIVSWWSVRSASLTRLLSSQEKASPRQAVTE
jgi:hypothetical protein